MINISREDRERSLIRAAVMLRNKYKKSSLVEYNLAIEALVESVDAWSMFELPAPKEHIIELHPYEGQMCGKEIIDKLNELVRAFNRL